MRIAIAGPGRSGTSLLVKLFHNWGFNTTSLANSWDERAQAGLESSLSGTTDLEVDKDPWAFEYIDKIPEADLRNYDALIVPIRRWEEASISRSVQERQHKALDLADDRWKWSTKGEVVGGAVSRCDVYGISSALAIGLWELLEKASRRGVPVIVVNFPRFANDFDYLWNQFSSLISDRISCEEAKRIWAETVDVNKVRIQVTEDRDLRIAELEALVDAMRVELASATHAREVALAQLNDMTQAVRSELPPPDVFHAPLRPRHRKMIIRGALGAGVIATISIAADSLIAMI